MEIQDYFAIPYDKRTESDHNIIRTYLKTHSRKRIIEDYFKIPYRDRFFVYTNLVFVADLNKLSFHKLLSHERANDNHSVSMVIHETIKNNYGSLNGKKILDVGSSIGHFSFLMTEEGAKVTGIECDYIKVEIARAIAHSQHLKNVSFVESRIEDYVQTQPADAFDLVLMHSVFDYIPIEDNTDVLMCLSQMSPLLYTTVLVDSDFVLDNSMYTDSSKLLEKIYGPRDLWVFSRW